MAPVLMRRVLDSSIWSTLDASQPKISVRDTYSYGGVNPTVIGIPIGIALVLVIISCCIKWQRFHAVKESNRTIAVSTPRDLGVPRTIRRPQAASVPPPASEDVLDPPPPYVPLQTLAPAYKPPNNMLERSTDTEGNVENRGQAGSILAV